MAARPSDRGRMVRKRKMTPYESSCVGLRDLRPGMLLDNWLPGNASSLDCYRWEAAGRDDDCLPAPSPVSDRSREAGSAS